ncbi:hypothetical protein DACRYDRAFT_109279 [Dacryopinax primogenitus]|uniref:Uncharacterized protein n=1 Tax=Dacryopinax primogenitus (strain DJM 731) TaxID=1858805 RepID=M5FUF1_DACPD|nr:uncharacterized protein DACRYDRAFT_109279 [Dacryopinax primogenitus]EJT99853.1 hypothetical protein DACRYDRAFT_109279 [Dacryopinax primogenitus]
MTSIAPLDVWVDNLFGEIWFQPDDEKAFAAFEAALSEDIRIEFVNGAVLPRSVYLGFVKSYRKESFGTDLGNPSLSMNINDADKQTGTVAQFGKFSTKNKATGKETLSTAATIIEVEFRDGKRVMTSLTEVTN